MPPALAACFSSFSTSIEVDFKGQGALVCGGRWPLSLPPSTAKLLTADSAPDPRSVAVLLLPEDAQKFMLMSPPLHLDSTTSYFSHRVFRLRSRQEGPYSKGRWDGIQRLLLLLLLFFSFAYICFTLHFTCLWRGVGHSPCGSE